MACADSQVAVQKRENIRMLSLDGLSGEHDAFPYQSTVERRRSMIACEQSCMTQ
jgi:hypothetical protein